MLLRHPLLRFSVRTCSRTPHTAVDSQQHRCSCSVPAAAMLLQQRPKLLLLGNGQHEGHRQHMPRRGLRLMPPVCMGRRSSKIAVRKACLSTSCVWHRPSISCEKYPAVCKCAGVYLFPKKTSLICWHQVSTLLARYISLQFRTLQCIHLWNKSCTR